MSDTAQSRAVRNYRSRLAERGMARFEVLGRVTDRELIRSLAKRLIDDDPEAHRLRAVVSRCVAGESLSARRCRRDPSPALRNRS